MTIKPAFDVMVVGGGPGGSVAAKRCTEAGYATLLIEKKRLPRDKVCTGMVMGAWAHDIMQQEFGDIPETVLVHPPCLRGHRLHVAGAEPQDLEWQTPLTWRRDLDFWMLDRARQAGVTIREVCNVVRVTQDRDVARVTIREQGALLELTARFVVGADGSTSVVRRSLFPELKVRYSPRPAAHCYKGQLDLDRDFIHWFFPKALPRPRFNVNHKNDVFLIEGSGIKELRTEINETLGPRGFSPEIEPQWKDGCAIALLHDHLLAGSFVPAQGNILLVGDAAGLIFPNHLRGDRQRHSRSGLAAAEAIKVSIRNGNPAASIYLKEIESIVDTVRQLCVVQDRLTSSANDGPDAMAHSLVAAYRGDTYHPGPIAHSGGFHVTELSAGIGRGSLSRRTGVARLFRNNQQSEQETRGRTEDNQQHRHGRAKAMIHIRDTAVSIPRDVGEDTSARTRTRACPEAPRPLLPTVTAMVMLNKSMPTMPKAGTAAPKANERRGQHQCAHSNGDPSETIPQNTAQGFAHEPPRGLEPRATMGPDFHEHGHGQIP